MLFIMKFKKFEFHNCLCGRLSWLPYPDRWISVNSAAPVCVLIVLEVLLAFVQSI